VSFTHCYVNCKACGGRITLAIHSYNHVQVNQHRAEKLQCQICLKVSIYSGVDFKTATLTASHAVSVLASKHVTTWG
jgi:hypothetical protein